MAVLWNFPGTGLAVDFPTNVIGIGMLIVRCLSKSWFRVEGVLKGVGFS